MHGCVYTEVKPECLPVTSEFPMNFISTEQGHADKHLQPSYSNRVQ